jgi:hypothetical protein
MGNNAGQLSKQIFFKLKLDYSSKLGKLTRQPIVPIEIEILNGQLTAFLHL